MEYFQTIYEFELMNRYNLPISPLFGEVEWSEFSNVMEQLKTASQTTGVLLEVEIYKHESKNLYSACYWYDSMEDLKDDEGVGIWN